MDYYGYNDYYDYGYALGGAFIIVLVVGLIALAVTVLQTIAFWKIFKKAGKNGWEAIIPFYGNYVLMEIAGLNWWWFLLLFAPMACSVFGVDWLGYLVSYFAFFNCYYNLAKKFNKGTGFAVCLTLFTPICASILAFSKNDVYDRNVAVSNNGLFGPSANNNYSNNDNNYSNNNNNYYQNNYQSQNGYNNTVNNVNSTDNVQTDTNQEVRFCGNCGTKLDEDVRFCPNCGKEKI